MHCNAINNTVVPVVWKKIKPKASRYEGVCGGSAVHLDRDLLKSGSLARLRAAGVGQSLMDTCSRIR